MTDVKAAPLRSASASQTSDLTSTRGPADRQLRNDVTVPVAPGRPSLAWRIEWGQTENQIPFMGNGSET